MKTIALAALIALAVQSGAAAAADQKDIIDAQAQEGAQDDPAVWVFSRKIAKSGVVFPTLLTGEVCRKFAETYRIEAGYNFIRMNCANTVTGEVRFYRN